MTRNISKCPYADFGIEQLADAMLPRTKYNFSIYLENIKRVAARLKTLCEAGHIAEQKHITESIESLNSGRHSSLKMHKTQLTLCVQKSIP